MINNIKGSIMASAFSHIAVPIALRLGLGKNAVPTSLLLFSSILSAAPDLDVISFRLGISYESQWGHRGFTHSLFFALLFSLLPMFFYRSFKTSRLSVYVVSFLSLASHGLLDALTNGGLGVAFFWPFNSQRFFLPWQVIEVSPISIKRFFTDKGLVVLCSELYYIWLPCLASGFLLYLFSRIVKKIFLKRAS